MPGWLRSAGSGRLTWMLSNGTSTAWNNPQQRKGRTTRPRGANRERHRRNKRERERRNENQSDQRVCRRPGEGTALLYRSAGLREEDRLFAGAISLAHG